MSAIAALKGYRTQFLYSLHYILSSLSKDLIYRLEGEEDLDVLNGSGKLLFALQLKNLGQTITLSDVLSDKKTSFIQRFLDNYREAIPILVSYGNISQELKKWNEHHDSISEKEKVTLKKYKVTTDDWKLVKNKIRFIEINEKTVAEEVEKMLKNNFVEIDPIPTIGFLLNWLQTIAEKQHPITKKDFYNKVEDFAKYLTERIAVHNQFGLILKPLHKTSTINLNQKLLEKEFYNATLTRYEHILLGLDINRIKHLERINEELKENNTIIIKGASGQGKTALLYSYVYQYLNDWLSYELNIQDDPITIQQSIQAIASISKKLDIPTVFVINVNPNTTEWLQIIKESAHYNQIKFLVAIRNEDWYRASAVGVEFEHKEIDLLLTKEEAEIIYLKLNERNKVSHFTDFEHAWIQIGSDAPLLEFVYSITQGDSLYNKLKQQIQQILKEDQLNKNQQIEFLRIVSLAHSLGAKIDVTKLSTNVDYQFIIEKLENEYLIRRSTDKKYLQGLHIIRSEKLVEILFDEFVSRKDRYSYKCIPLMGEEDLYLFLLQLFHLKILKGNEFISELNNNISVDNWSVYTSILKSFIWLGTKEYVENNRQVIDECRLSFGDAWILCVDFMFGGNYDKNTLLDLLKLDKEKIKEIDRVNKKLLPKETVFNLVTLVINELNFPIKSPITIFEWKSFGETLFWLKNIPNEKEQIEIYKETEFENTFKMMDSKSLSKLMLGMHTYSQELNEIRNKYSKHFIEKIKEEFDIIHFDIGEDEITIHFIIDIIKNDNVRPSNDFVVNILDIIRSALPDKKKFNSQGYGHRLRTLSTDYDETHKTIPIENMPLEEWVNINASIGKLYDYENRPKNWNEYLVLLNAWEIRIKGKVTEFNCSFTKLFAGSKTYTPVVPVMHNALIDRDETIKQPKSITDALGIYGGKKTETKSENEKEKVNKKLQSKYELFFNSLTDFKGSVENFIQQSGQTLYSKIQLKTEEGHIHNEDMERLSQINLYNAIEKLSEYNIQYQNAFGEIDVSHISRIDINPLVTAATVWKDFLNDNDKGDRSFNRIIKLKTDFENKLIKEFKQVSKLNSFLIKYFNGKQTNEKPVIIIDGESPFWSLMGYSEAYIIIQKVIDNPEYTSLKYLMLQIGFSSIYFIQTIQNKTLNNQWIEVKLYNIKDKLLEELSILNSAPQLIEDVIVKKLNIQSWTKLYPEFNEINKAAEAYAKIVLLVDSLQDLQLLNEINLPDSDQKRLQLYWDKVGFEINESLQIVLDSLSIWLEMFPLDESTYIDSEEEREYFKAIFNIRENIFPEPKNDDEVFEYALNMEIIPKWVTRLKICTESWGVFLLLLNGKYIVNYSKFDMKSTS